MANPGTEPTAVAPPAGTGNAPGLGEAFSVDLNSGQGRYSIPLPLPDGVANWQPQLNLEYGSQNGNGPFGYGWQIPLRQIQYRLDYGVPGEQLAERFMDSGGSWCALGRANTVPGSRPPLPPTGARVRDGWSWNETARAMNWA